MNDENQKTLDAYEQGLEEYNAAAISEVTGSVKEWIDAGLKILPKGAKILEIGSAHGRDADYMESKGFTVDRTDAASSFVEYMKRQGHEARMLNALTDEYGQSFDMVYASAVLLHFTSEQITHVLRQVRKALNEDGLFAFSVKIGEGTAWSNAKLNSPRFFSYWNERDLRALLEQAHLEVIFWEEGSRGHDNGKWYHVITRKTNG